MQKQLWLAMLGMLVGGRAAAQQSGGEDAATALRRFYADLSGYVVKAAELVPADKYGYRPAPTVRTVGQLFGHLADAHNYYCARAAGRNVEWADPIEKGVTDKATLVQRLTQSVEGCNAAYAGKGQVSALIENLAHTDHHYGNIVTYLRTLGLVPPSS